MKILHVISSGGMYGAEAVILELSAGIRAGQYGEIYLGVFSHAGQPVPELHVAATAAGFASELVPCRGQLDLAVPKAIRDMANRLHVDVVHAHGYKADIYSYLAFRAKTRPALVSTCHTWYDNDRAVRLYGAADRWVLRHFDEIVAVSAEVNERLLGAGIPAHRIHLVRNGVAVPEAIGRSTTTDADAVPIRVGLVGRLAPEKGVDIFLRAVALLAGRIPQTEFFVAGDGPEMSALEELAQELSLEQTVKLLGQQRSMDQFYRSLDVQVSASRQEGLPMTLLEGMSRGLPIVATAVGEVPDVVVQGTTGLLVEPGSAEALADAIACLLADKQLRERLGAAGRTRVQQLFSARRMAKDYVDIYRLALSHRPAHPHATKARSSSL